MMVRSIKCRCAAAFACAVILAMTAWNKAQDKPADPAWPAPVAAVPAGPTTFQVDPVHSAALFKIRHMGVSNFHGRFNEIKGTATLDPASLATAVFDVQVPIASVDSKTRDLDEHLKTADFFDMAQHPVMAFKSTSVNSAGPGKLAVTGDFSLHGVTKSITVNMDVIGINNTSMMGLRAGVETTFTIKRSDFAMDYGVSQGALGDDVEITVALELAVPEPPKEVPAN